MSQYSLIHLLSEKTVIDGNSVCITEQLEEKDYNNLKQFFGKLNGKWNSSKQAHVFPDSVFVGVLDYVREHQVIPVLNPYHLFPTPSGIIEEMLSISLVEAKIIGLNEGWVEGLDILEPSAGTGAIASAINEKTNGKANIDVYEIDPVNQAILREKGFNIVGEDFLVAPTHKKYDIILINPPFNRKEYVKHVCHAHSMLKETGVLVAILPKITDPKGNAVARLIARTGEAWDHPPKSFKGAGTLIDTICAIMEPEYETCPPCGYDSKDEFDLDMFIKGDSKLNTRTHEFIKNTLSTPNARDLFGELSEEVRTQGLKFLDEICAEGTTLEACIELSDEGKENYLKCLIERVEEEMAYVY